MQLLGPSVWRRALGALRFGVGISRPVGDPFALGGAFLVREGAVLDARPAKDAGTLPDFEGLARTAAALG